MTEVKDPKEIQVWNNCIDAAILKAKLASLVINRERIKEFISKLEALKIS